MNLAILRSLTLAILLPLAIVACSGPPDGLAGRFAWYDYVSGQDMQRTCSRSTLERYRVVFNAEYTKQVRTYDILQKRDGATLRGRVFLGSLTSDASFSSAVGGLIGRTGQLPLNAAGFAAFKQAVAGAEPYLAGEPVYLRSDSYFWVVLECRGGRVLARAFTGPRDHLERLPFRRFLLANDPTGVPVRVQRPLPADQLSGFGRAYSLMESETTERAEGDAGPLFQFRFENGRIGILGG